MRLDLRILIFASMLSPLLRAGDGAAGLGDTYFPELGNGGYDVQRYDLALEIDPQDAELTKARATIAAVAKQELSSFHLELHKLEVDAITVADAPAKFERDGDELIVTPAQAIAMDAPFETVVDYHGVPEPVPTDALPIGKGVGCWKAKDALYVFSEPNGASSLYPVNDHPADKALYGLKVTVPKGYVVATNGLVTNKGGKPAAAGGTLVYEFATECPTASYLITLGVDRFDVERSKMKDGKPLTYYFPKDTPENRRKPIRKTKDMLAHLEKCFGPYPFESCGGLLSTLPIPGALESQGLPIYGVTAASEHVVAHELAHMWFGDNVSVKQWKDIWIAEGFAEYGAWLWLEHAEGKDALADKVESTYEQVKRGKVKPPGDPGRDSMFGSEVYERGPLAVHALRRACGDDAFFAILKEWNRRYLHSNASVEDFFALAVEIAGEKVRPVLQAWVFDRDVPEMDV